MKINQTATAKDVQSVYRGRGSALWELLMGEQIHVGGMASSLTLAEKAGIGPGMKGIDLCCCNGAGMRFLVRIKQVAFMRGVDFTHQSVMECRKRSASKNFADCIRVTEADVCNSGLPDGEADFVWGEDSWCYVADKGKLIAEASRMVRTGGKIAFTDWMEGEGLTDGEAQRVMNFIKIPSLATLKEYTGLLEKNGCRIVCAEDTGLFPEFMDLYVKMVTSQHAYDALRCLWFDRDMLKQVQEELAFAQGLVREGKIIQGMVVAEK